MKKLSRTILLVLFVAGITSFTNVRDVTEYSSID
jgi:hypothetical protein